MGTRAGRLPAAAVRTELAGELSRRDFVARAGGLGVGAVVLGALPLVGRLAAPVRASAASLPTDATLQAFYDTMIPGRKVDRTELGHPIDPLAIAGVDPEPGAVEADALLLGQNPQIGFEALAPPFLAELEGRSLAHGGDFLHLDWDGREAVCIDGTSFQNPTRVVWEAAAAVAFTAFCAAGTIPNATDRDAVGYAVMGHPGTAPHGYRDFSYGKALNRGRTRRGYLP
jgi:hypothetical protein